MAKRIDRNDPKYWERELKKRGLGINQPLTDNSEGEMMVSMTGTADEMSSLRKKIDGSDGFMMGHQIQKVRSIEREIPEWALNDKEVQRILLLAFPKMKTEGKQRSRAGKWARLINLYYRMEQPAQIVAKELKINDVLLTRWIQKISYVAQGLNVNGKPRRHPPRPLVKEPERANDTIEGPLLPTAGTSGAGKSRTASEVLQMQKNDGLQ